MLSIHFKLDYYQTLKWITFQYLHKSPQIMDFACRGYPESTPNSLHKDRVREKLEDSTHYTPSTLSTVAYSYSYSYDDLFLDT